MHNPWDGHWPLVCDWKCHLARGSAGGDDYKMNVGTPVTAAFSGTLRNVYDAATNLNKAELTADHDPNLSFYHLHVSRFAPAGHYNEGDVIAWSGGAPGAHGSGTATGPHLHVNAFYRGQIEDVHKYFTTTAASGATPIGEDDMPTPQELWTYPLISPDTKRFPKPFTAAEWLTAARVREEDTLAAVNAVSSKLDQLITLLTPKG